MKQKNKKMKMVFFLSLLGICCLQFLTACSNIIELDFKTKKDSLEVPISGDQDSQDFSDNPRPLVLWFNHTGLASFTSFSEGGRLQSINPQIKLGHILYDQDFRSSGVVYYFDDDETATVETMTLWVNSRKNFAGLRGRMQLALQNLRNETNNPDIQFDYYLIDIEHHRAALSRACEGLYGPPVDHPCFSTFLIWEEFANQVITEVRGILEELYGVNNSIQLGWYSDPFHGYRGRAASFLDRIYNRLDFSAPTSYPRGDNLLDNFENLRASNQEKIDLIHSYRPGHSIVPVMKTRYVQGATGGQPAMHDLIKWLDFLHANEAYLNNQTTGLSFWDAWDYYGFSDQKLREQGDYILDIANIYE